MREIKVRLDKRSYPIKISHGALQKAGRYISLSGTGRDSVVITNPKIRRLYGKRLRRSLEKNGISCHILTAPDSESSKSYRSLTRLINEIARTDRGKRPFIIAFGGGVIGDLAGFIAAVYRRGVPLIQIPTTLVAQVDSAIGGKVAIDLAVAKNLVGAFYQPAMVISDTSLLKTLPKREIRCGLAEIIKYSIISSRSFFDYLDKHLDQLKTLRPKSLDHVIARCCLIKSRVVSADERDTKGIRMILNYGHTIGHAIEAATGYRGAYNHGEAVAIGMVAAAVISVKLGMLSPKESDKIKKLISKAGLPVQVRGSGSMSIYKALCHDKKFTHGVNRFVIPVSVGKVRVVRNIPKDIILEAIREVTV